MIRNWLRNWLFDMPPNQPKHIPVMEPAPYDPEAWFFTIKPVDNGYIITFRIYDEKNPRVSNSYGPGPGYTDKIRLVHAKDSLIEILGAMIVEENIKK